MSRSPASYSGPGERPNSLARHAAETIGIATPLATAQLVQMAMAVTDTVLLGGIGGEALAAGGLGSTMEMTVVVVLQGVLTAVSVLVSQARGAGRDRDIPGLYWTGLLLTACLVVPAFALLSFTEPLLLLAGEPPALAHAAGGFVSVLRWCIPGALLGTGMLRAFLPAIGAGVLILWVTLAAAIINGVLCYGLIHGKWGLPAMGLNGAAMATVVVHSFAAGALLILLHVGRPRFVRWARPRLVTLRLMLRLGMPVAASFAVEAGLFLAVALLVGRLGAAALAAQSIALQATSVSFMVPLGIANAANVRVGHSVGARDTEGARLAGLVAIGLGAAFELLAAAVLTLYPELVVRAYLDPADGEAFTIALGLLRIAAVFAVVDGVQCVANGALRGLGDTRVPFALAAFGYWGIGFPAAWWLTAVLGAPGAWWGLAAALTVVALLLTRRFERRTRFAVATVAA